MRKMTNGEKEAWAKIFKLVARPVGMGAAIGAGIAATIGAGIGAVISLSQGIKGLDDCEVEDVEE